MLQAQEAIPDELAQQVVAPEDESTRRGGGRLGLRESKPVEGLRDLTLAALPVYIVIGKKRSG